MINDKHMRAKHEDRKWISNFLMVLSRMGLCKGEWIGPNYIINNDFNFWQRDGNKVTKGVNQGADRWATPKANHKRTK